MSYESVVLIASRFSRVCCLFLREQNLVLVYKEEFVGGSICHSVFCGVASVLGHASKRSCINLFVCYADFP